jgi:GxxExxY protein
MIRRKPGSPEVGGDRCGVDFAGEHLTGAIIGAAIDVHRTLGPGYIEAIYERALRVEMLRRNMPFRAQCSVPISYRGIDVGSHRLDLLVDATVVVELKTISDVEEIHLAILRSYLKAAHCEVGLILNFSKPALEIKRVFAAPIRAG